LRQTLDAADQKTSLDHAADLTRDRGAKSAVATLKRFISNDCPVRRSALSRATSANAVVSR
jgi:hypothetical protein